MRLKECSYCHGLYERRIEGKCPHCERVIKSHGKETEKTCPACHEKFVCAVTVDGEKFCPGCHVGLHFKKERGKTKVILQSEKETAVALVCALESHISRRDDTAFRFLRADRNAQLLHAYKIIEAATEFVGEKKEKLMPPTKLAEKMVRTALANGHGQATSLLYLRTSLTKLADEVWRETSRNQRINHNNQSIDISAYKV